MKKIPTIFERDWDGDRSRVLDVPAAGCEWVFNGEGVATRKYDGTCCLMRDGKLFKRHEVRVGKNGAEGFEFADDDRGNFIGWIPVGGGPEDKWHREAFINTGGTLTDGTYELVGPKIQGNPENEPLHRLVRHTDAEQMGGINLTFSGIREVLAIHNIEGIVWHHPDGRMAKIKARDFGLSRKSSLVA